MRIALGPVASFADDACTPVAGGTAVVVRVGTELRAFRNRCLHQDSPLAGGWVRDGVLTCPLHFWRYCVDDGTLVGSRGALERVTVETVDGRASLIVDDAAPPRSLRDALLDRARSYDRDKAWRRDTSPEEHR